MYPTRFPGTPLPFVPGFPPSTKICPVLSRRRPTIQLSNVVFPHPLAPSNPYLQYVSFVFWNRKPQSANRVKRRSEVVNVRRENSVEKTPLRSKDLFEKQNTNYNKNSARIRYAKWFSKLKNCRASNVHVMCTKCEFYRIAKYIVWIYRSVLLGGSFFFLPRWNRLKFRIE